ncbi:MarR family winged helix-turn-helix transcriptional regulator [Streptomyces galbus]|uniref:Winged helix-turn-helix transcriptional regulator n=1 Tax=Streptomyces galbus TaxID=33898 RepID=A0A4U5WXC9_STRGB|nr:MarR family winged helix-turn-helix transcriptional regulator [Streptomyces galbus]TKT06552.1 winged helix-turn-helix transcriptional regulator [Streptomyces galbus]GHD54004.1 MarR family transcriptional regulator [Streptomyces galbus]
MSTPVDPSDLDLGTLALFVGSAAAGAVQEDLAAQGFGDLRTSHGYVFQHLIDARPTVSDLSARLDMTQQGASKVVAELEQLGYVERLPSAHDARVRHVALTRRGKAAVTAARDARQRLERRLRERTGTPDFDAARSVLIGLLDELGGTAAVSRRDVRPPR